MSKAFHKKTTLNVAAEPGVIVNNIGRSDKSIYHTRSLPGLDEPLAKTVGELFEADN
jgi:hypothetical protein